jgi:hypothetical protein
MDVIAAADAVEPLVLHGFHPMLKADGEREE